MSRKFNNPTVTELKRKYRWQLEQNYFKLWMSHYKIKELNRFQYRFLFKQFWNNGNCGVFKVKHLDGAESLLFAPWNPIAYNEYMEISKCQAINISGSSIVPIDIKTVNEDAVIMYCNSERKPVSTLINYYLDRITEVEILIRNNLFASSTPFIAKVSPELKQKAQDLIDKLFAGESVLFVDGENDALDILSTGGQFMADKLVQLKEYYNNLILGTIFGIDHKTFSSGDGKQFNTVDSDTSEEVVTNAYENDIQQNIQTGIDEIQEAFGITLTLENNVEESRSVYDEQGQEDAIQPDMKEGNEDGRK